MDTRIYLLCEHRSDTFKEMKLWPSSINPCTPWLSSKGMDGCKRKVTCASREAVHCNYYLINTISLHLLKCLPVTFLVFGH